MSSSDDEDEGQGDQLGDQDEYFSSARGLGHPKVPELRPAGSSGQGGSQPPETKKTSGTLGLTGSIKDSRKRKATDEVIEAFSGPPKKRDPSHIKLKETG